MTKKNEEIHRFAYRISFNIRLTKWKYGRYKWKLSKMYVHNSSNLFNFIFNYYDENDITVEYSNESHTHIFREFFFHNLDDQLI